MSKPWVHGRHGYSTGCRCTVCTEAVKLYRASYRSSRRKDLDRAKAQPCVDCGGVFPPECMDFDHRPGEIKLFSIGNRTLDVSRAALTAEIAKCDLVCANCHRVRTKTRGYFRRSS